MDIKRVLSAVVLIPVLIAFIHYAPEPLFLALVAGVGALAFDEYRRIMSPDISKDDMIFGHSLNASVIVIVYITENIAFSAMLAFIAIAFYHVIQQKKHETLVTGFLRVFAGMFYCALLPSYILLIRILDGSEYLYLLLVTIWIIDTFAYYTGRSFGRRKLLPHISPKKTVEGSIGGTVGAVAVLLTAKFLFFNNFSVMEAVALGVILSFVSQAGDLFESLMKRAGGMKDSGTLIPGHGGMLDRIDSLLFAAPVMFYFTMFLNL